MERIWLANYPPGIDSDIVVNECASVNEILAQSCRKFGSRPAFRNFGAELTYGQLDRSTRDFAAFLQSLPGMGTGTRVAIMLPNLLQFPIAFYGVLRAGMVAVNVNPLYTSRELQHQLKDSGAKIIVILENFASVLQSVLAETDVKHVVITEVGDLLPAPRRWLMNTAVKRLKKLVPEWHIPQTTRFRNALRNGATATWRDPKAVADDVAILQYTGGTTGCSKGAILTHGNLAASVSILRTWSPEVAEGCEVAVTALPLYHMFALLVNCIFLTKIGALSLLIANPRDLEALLGDLKKTPFTMITGVTTLFRGMMDRPGFAQLDFSRLRWSLSSGAALHRGIAERWREVTGCRIYDGYALTEAAPVAGGIVGSQCNGIVPMPSTYVSIRDDAGWELPPASHGEICVRGPQVMRAYWQRPEETRNAFTADGWLRTGDIGMLDERGFLHITERKKDMIIVSGFKVYPAEVEEVISSMEGILECGVIGVPDAVTGEAVKAFVVARNADVSADAITAFCRQGLAGYKVPKSVEFRVELPKSPIGKVLRRELRAANVGTAGNPQVAAGGDYQD